MQDLTGVPAVVDLAAMRAAVARAGGDPARVDRLVPVDPGRINHSVQVDAFGSDRAYGAQHRARVRAAERRALRAAALGAGRVPQLPGACRPAWASCTRSTWRRWPGWCCPDPRRPDVLAYDFVLGTDSHTPMVNGLGVLGWGVGGIEAVGVALGGAVWVPAPEIVGVRLRRRAAPPGRPPPTWS